jgi:hypothetical protein
MKYSIGKHFCCHSLKRVGVAFKSKAMQFGENYHVISVCGFVG